MNQRQEINLYSSFDHAKPAARFLTWPRLWYAYLIISCIFTVYYLILVVNLYYQKKENTDLLLQSKNQEAIYLNLKSHFPELFFTSTVDISIESLAKEVSEQKILLQTLNASSAFSGDLIAFSTNIAPDVWLTTISLTSDNNLINLKGKSISMDALQQFISQLTSDKLFAGYIFNIDNINKIMDENKNPIQSFELSMRKPKA